MPTRERPRDRATYDARRLLVATGGELRTARLGAGLSQRAVAGAIGLSHTTVGRLEAGRTQNASVVNLARVSAIVGLDLSVRLFPAGDPMRDAAQRKLLGRVRLRLGPGIGWRTEVPLPIPGDRRAWDALLRIGATRIGIEAESRVRDEQAFTRRLALKRRDGDVDHVIVVLADTRANRAALPALRVALRPEYRLSSRQIMRALAEGRAPGGSGIAIL